jgi:FKBP-type peptidyl-prolyl cis-trans isomerase FkpA
VVLRVSRIVAVAALCLAPACSDTPTTPSAFAPYSQVDYRLGTGTEAAAGTTVSLNYTGWLYDPARPDGKGVQFDTSVGTDPLIFTIGAGHVISGFDQGVTGMKVGGARRVTVPPSLGYGGTRNNSIPPYATLVFDIDLLDVTVPAGSGR